MFSRCSYEPERDGSEIEVVLTEVSEMDSASPEVSFPKGNSRLDSYDFSNDKMQCEIEKRIALFEEAKAYYGHQGRTVDRDGLGTQDGEYVLASDKNNPEQMYIAFLLEPQSTQAREDALSFEDFLRRMQS